jgi:hypothetical protein
MPAGIDRGERRRILGHRLGEVDDGLIVVEQQLPRAAGFDPLIVCGKPRRDGSDVRLDLLAFRLLR